MTRSTPPSTNYMFVLPWLKVPRSIRFGEVEIAPFELAISDSDPLVASARKVFDFYRKLGGAPAEGSIMWPVNRSPLSVSLTDDRTLSRHRTALSMGLIAMNEYYRDVAFPNVTEAHCDGFLHPLTEDMTHLAFYKRRREGFYGDAFPIEQLTTTVPLAASVDPVLRINEELLDALADALGRTDVLAERLVSAIPPFLQGSRLAETTAVIDDIVWIGAAFERLLEPTKPIGDNLAKGIATAFSSFPHGSTSWSYTSLSGKTTTTETGPWVQRWMREYYGIRSSLHSGSHDPGTWTELDHSVIAAEVFSLLVKLDLRGAGLHSLTEGDECAAEALDERIERLVNRGRPVESWWEPFDAAKRRRTTAAMTTALTAAMTSTAPTPGTATVTPATTTEDAEDGESSDAAT